MIKSPHRLPHTHQNGQSLEFWLQWTSANIWAMEESSDLTIDTENSQAVSERLEHTNSVNSGRLSSLLLLHEQNNHGDPSTCMWMWVLCVHVCRYVHSCSAYIWTCICIYMCVHVLCVCSILHVVMHMWIRVCLMYVCMYAFICMLECFVCT